MGNAESTTAMASVYGTIIRAISGFRKLLGPKASAVKVNSRGVTCEVSGVRCQVSGVRCQVSGVSLFFLFFKMVELVCAWSVINGPTPSSFLTLSSLYLYGAI